MIGFWIFIRNANFSVFCWVFFLFFLNFLSSSAKADFQSSVNIGLLGDLYFQRNVNNAQGFVDILIGNEGFKDKFWLDIGAGALVGDTSQSYVKIPELYYQIGFSEQAHLVLGRSIRKWSYLDDSWMMGIIQPLFKWNMALPEEQGLTGLFLNIPLNEKIKLMFFSSYIFLPSQGPDYELVNGEIRSSNPWFMQPVRIINFADRETKLRYNVSVPKTSDIIFRSSYGGKLGTAYDKKSWLFNLFYLSKPKNDLIIPFDGQLNLTTFTGDVTIQPMVARHHIFGLDFGWNFVRFKSLFSWLHESHVYYKKIPNFTHPVIPSQDMFSFSQRIKLSDSQSLSFSYLKVFRKPNEIEGVFSGNRISSFLSRNRFENTFHLKWEGKFQKLSDQYLLKTYVSYFQSFIVDHAWISIDARWSLSENVKITGHCDFFGGYKRSPVDSDFISQFQNNDRCLMGGSYAF